jgi:hypothetical protein
MVQPLPLRRAGDAAPIDVPGLPLPPGRLPLLYRGRPLKRWRYAGIYGERVMLCAAAVRIGMLAQWFWALWDREAGALVEATRFVPGSLAVSGGRVRVRGRRTRIDLVLEPAGEPVEVCSPHGSAHIWTRKLPVRARGTVLVDGRAIDVDARGLVDESAGYHARRTAWSWSAGVGVTADGRDVAWNLVAGVHDAAVASERTVWVDGTALEPGPVTFADDLSAVTGGDGTVLTFAAEAERARSDDLVVVAGEYRQPLGVFTGTLPGGVALASGLGVMERHDVRW